MIEPFARGQAFKAASCKSLGLLCHQTTARTAGWGCFVNSSSRVLSYLCSAEVLPQIAGMAYVTV